MTTKINIVLAYTVNADPRLHKTKPGLTQDLNKG